MGEKTRCANCNGVLDRHRDAHVSLSTTSVNVRTAEKEADERVFCTDCSATYFDAELPSSKSSEDEAVRFDESVYH